MVLGIPTATRSRQHLEELIRSMFPSALRAVEEQDKLSTHVGEEAACYCV